MVRWRQGAFIGMLVLRHGQTVVLRDHRRAGREGALVRLLLMVVLLRLRRQGALVRLRVDGQRVFVLVREALGAVVVDGADGQGVEGVVADDGGAALRWDAVEFVVLLFAS